MNWNSPKDEPSASSNSSTRNQKQNSGAGADSNLPPNGPRRSARIAHKNELKRLAMAEINEVPSEPKVKMSKKTVGKKVSKSLLQKAKQANLVMSPIFRTAISGSVASVLSTISENSVLFTISEFSEIVDNTEAEFSEIVDNTEATDPEIAEPEIVATEATDPDQMANPEIVDVTETAGPEITDPETNETDDSRTTKNKLKFNCCIS
ncbi:uncharacterized protein LOC108046023 [Drosophila rhopaloa]|uniref:Uncharacterized protein n=1 Tax=Drosophila rhopaloa TaxID=1041015 RepID=A0ABM5HIW2_DRORH|nr:uncharacterized protein LOC108046023 [Drosophila rhopaloa]